MRRCPVCGDGVAARDENPVFPFCEPRCKQIDLGKWLGGDYVISRSLLPESTRPWPDRHDAETD